MFAKTLPVLAAILIVSPIVGGCQDAPATLVVRVTSDLEVDAIVVRAAGPRMRRSLSIGERRVVDVPFPIEVALETERDPDLAVTIDVIAERSGEPDLTRRFETFITRETRVLAVHFSDDCLACAPTQRCAPGCPEQEPIPAGSLPLYGPNPTGDGGVDEGDATPDTAPDTAPDTRDASVDTTSDAADDTGVDAGPCPEGERCTVAGAENATGVCRAEICEDLMCDEGFGDCDGDPGCETPLGTSRNCRRCGETCEFACEEGCVNVVGLAAGQSHTCASTRTGSLYCWGDPLDGRIGIDATAPVTTPTRVPLDGEVVRIAAGDRHTCVALRDGRVACFGANDAGQLGDPAAPGGHLPIISTRLSDPTSMCASDTFTCIANASAVDCFGTSADVDLDAAIRPAVTGDYHVGCGPRHMCVGGNGGGYCQGADDGAQLGLPMMFGSSRVEHMDAGELHSCALVNESATRPGELYCWGTTTDGQIGRDDQPTYGQPYTRERGRAPWRAAATGARHTCAIQSSSVVQCVGRNDRGQLGNPDDTLANAAWHAALFPAPYALAQDVTAGAHHTCALVDPGAVFCWGANDAGQVGDGSREDAPRPVRVRR